MCWSYCIWDVRLMSHISQWNLLFSTGDDLNSGISGTSPPSSRIDWTTIACLFPIKCCLAEFGPLKVASQTLHSRVISPMFFDSTAFWCDLLCKCCSNWFCDVHLTSHVSHLFEERELSLLCCWVGVEAFEESFVTLFFIGGWVALVTVLITKEIFQIGENYGIFRATYLSTAIYCDRVCKVVIIILQKVSNSILQARLLVFQ